VFFSRRSAQSIFELVHESLDLPFCAAARISVPAFQQDYKDIPLSVDLIEIVRAELLPFMVQLVTQLFPPGGQNVLVH
jgi:hypothetical protein